MEISVRDEYLKNGAKNPYYEGNLCARDKEYIRGFDACVEREIDGFFGHIREYGEELTEVGLDPKELDISAIVADNYDDADIAKLDEKTVMIGTLHDCMLDYMERKRTGLIRDMIETTARA